jgi:hypothetical protein
MQQFSSFSIDEKSMPPVDMPPEWADFGMPSEKISFLAGVTMNAKDGLWVNVPQMGNEMDN